MAIAYTSCYHFGFLTHKYYDNRINKVRNRRKANISC